MRILALFLSILLSLSASDVHAQFLKPKHPAVDVRDGVGPDSSVIHQLEADDVPLQLARYENWLMTIRGWVAESDMEWAFPRAERGEPAVSVMPVASMDDAIMLHVVSPNGERIALHKLGSERDVLIFNTSDQTFVTSVDVGDFGGNAGGYTELNFLDDRTLLLQTGNRGSGIRAPEFPYEELVVDIPSGKILSRSRGLFGYLGRNPHDQEGNVISFIGDFVRLHDPDSLETINIAAACIGNDSACKQADVKIFDASFDSERNEILTVARVRDRSQAGQPEYFLVVRASSIRELETKLSGLEGERVDISAPNNVYKSYFSYIPSQNLLLTSDSRPRNSVGKVVGIWDVERSQSAGFFHFDGLVEKTIAICKDERTLFGWTLDPSDEGALKGTVHLTSIYINEDRTLEFRSEGRSIPPGHRSGTIVCLDPGRRAVVSGAVNIFSVDGSRVPPAAHERATQYSYSTFGLVVGDAPVDLGGTDGTVPRIDLDALANRASQAAELGISAPPLVSSFINPEGELVVMRGGRSGGIHILEKNGTERPIADSGARQVFFTTIRAQDGSKMLLMSSRGRLSILDTVSGDLTEISEMTNLDKYNEEFGVDRFLKETWSGESTSGGSVFAFTADGQFLHVLDRETSMIEVIDSGSGTMVRQYPSEIADCRSASMTTMLEDGMFACVDGATIDIVNFKTGTKIQTIPLSSFLQVKRATLDKSGRLLFQVVSDGMLVNDVASGREVARLYMEKRRYQRDADGKPIEESPARWLLMTPEGFYAGNDGADDLLQATHGAEEVYGIDKLRDALYRPDLVAEALKGDPERLVASAAREISLEKILHSGAAPEVIIRGELSGDRVKVEADIADLGGGIGRIEWRVNGVVQKTAVGEVSAHAELYLAEGENAVEAVAYNQANTIQTRSNREVFSVAASDVAPPRLFIMSVGVDRYALDRLRLEYAVHDATTLADALSAAGEGLYDEVHTEIILDEDVTREKLDERFRSLAERIRPNDVFIFFSAGHGKTIDGRFFYAPQDLTESTIAGIREQGIGHSTWQEWFSLLPAQKSLLLFDSCESGGLTETSVGRELRFRAANDLLGNSTGRALIAASSSTQNAMEGYEGHGVFTYAILRALTSADANDDGVIEIDELADAIERTVPQIAQEVFGEAQTPQYKRPHRTFDVVRQLSQL